ncbi:unnamed protein product [Paramecium sonneborni]|uniref:Tubby C-terminal domain-containing protein n=1 Tax=Paramecium sonneborni TaxID=65129 RepID=A0A8S1K4Z5_9CILI|nr:unnamed protein product [Paramecium sonneborni]
MFLNNISDSDDDDKDAPNVCLDTLGLSQEIDNKLTKVLIKNKYYKKNLGGEGAFYESNEIDLNTFTFEKNVFDQCRKQSLESVEIDQFKLLEIPQGASQDILDPLILSKQVSQSQQCQRDAIETSNNWVLEEIQKQQQYLEQLEKLEQFEKLEQQECQIEICNFQETSLSDLISIPPICPYSEKISQIQLPQPLQSFLVNSIPTEGMFQCKIIRDQSGLNRFMPKYRMYWCQNSQFLLAAKKSLNKNKYIITQDQEFQQNDQQILGKVEQSKQSKADYYLFDNGQKKKEQNVKRLRTQIGSVFFDTNQENKGRPRRMALVLRKSEKEIVQFISRKPQIINTQQCKKQIFKYRIKIVLFRFLWKSQKSFCKEFLISIKRRRKRFNLCIIWQN